MANFVYMPGNTSSWNVKTYVYSASYVNITDATKGITYYGQSWYNDSPDYYYAAKYQGFSGFNKSDITYVKSTWVSGISTTNKNKLISKGYHHVWDYWDTNSFLCHASYAFYTFCDHNDSGSRIRLFNNYIFTGTLSSCPSTPEWFVVPCKKIVFYPDYLEPTKAKLYVSIAAWGSGYSSIKTIGGSNSLTNLSVPKSAPYTLKFTNSESYDQYVTYWEGSTYYSNHVKVAAGSSITISCNASDAVACIQISAHRPLHGLKFGNNYGGETALKNLFYYMDSDANFELLYQNDSSGSVAETPKIKMYSIDTKYCYFPYDTNSQTAYKWLQHINYFTNGMGFVGYGQKTYWDAYMSAVNSIRIPFYLYSQNTIIDKTLLCIPSGCSTSSSMMYEYLFNDYSATIPGYTGENGKNTVSTNLGSATVICPCYKFKINTNVYDKCTINGWYAATTNEYAIPLINSCKTITLKNFASTGSYSKYTIDLNGGSTTFTYEVHEGDTVKASVNPGVGGSVVVSYTSITEPSKPCFYLTGNTASWNFQNYLNTYAPIIYDSTISVAHQGQNWYSYGTDYYGACQLPSYSGYSSTDVLWGRGTWKSGITSDDKKSLITLGYHQVWDTDSNTRMCKALTYFYYMPNYVKLVSTNNPIFTWGNGSANLRSFPTSYFTGVTLDEVCVPCRTVDFYYNYYDQTDYPTNMDVTVSAFGLTSSKKHISNWTVTWIPKNVECTMTFYNTATYAQNVTIWYDENTYKRDLNHQRIAAGNNKTLTIPAGSTILRISIAYDIALHGLDIYTYGPNDFPLTKLVKNLDNSTKGFSFIYNSTYHGGSVWNSPKVAMKPDPYYDTGTVAGAVGRLCYMAYSTANPKSYMWHETYATRAAPGMGFVFYMNCSDTTWTTLLSSNSVGKKVRKPFTVWDNYSSYITDNALTVAPFGHSEDGAFSPFWWRHTGTHPADIPGADYSDGKNTISTTLGTAQMLVVCYKFKIPASCSAAIGHVSINGFKPTATDTWYAIPVNADCKKITVDNIYGMGHYTEYVFSVNGTTKKVKIYDNATQELNIYSIAYGGNEVYLTAINKGDVYYSYVRVGDTWKKALPCVRVDGVWEPAPCYIRVGSEWKLCNAT